MYITVLSTNCVAYLYILSQPAIVTAMNLNCRVQIIIQILSFSLQEHDLSLVQDLHYTGLMLMSAQDISFHLILEAHLCTAEWPDLFSTDP